MTHSQYQVGMIKSFADLTSDLFLLRDALNELSLALSDLRFLIDEKQRAVANNETELILQRMDTGNNSRC
jgi:hypothetical protein